MSLRLAVAAAAVSLVSLARADVARAGDGVDLVRFMPEDAAIVMVVDVAGARDSDLFKDGLSSLVAMAPAGFALVEAAGIDPATALDTIAIGGNNANGNDDFAAVAEGRQAKTIVDLISKDPKSTAAKYHGVTYWTSGDGAIAFVDKRLYFARPAHIERTIDLALGKVKGAAKSAKAATLRAVIAATDTRNDVWAAMVMPADAAKSMKASGLEVTGVSLGASLSTTLGLEVKILNANDASAAAMLTQITNALPQLGPALGNIGLAAAAKSLQVDRDGLSVRMTITLTRAELVTLWTLVKGSLGGALGGLGGP
jgi:hypothetical protein